MAWVTRLQVVLFQPDLGSAAQETVRRTAPSAGTIPAAGSRPSAQCRFSSELFKQDRLILRHSAVLAADVLHGRTHVDEASRQVRQAEQRERSHDAQMTELLAKVPDGAALIRDRRTCRCGVRQSQS